AFAEGGDGDVHGVGDAGQQLVVGDAAGALPVVIGLVGAPLTDSDGLALLEVAAGAADQHEGYAADVVAGAFTHVIADHDHTVVECRARALGGVFQALGQARDLLPHPDVGLALDRITHRALLRDVVEAGVDVEPGQRDRPIAAVVRPANAHAARDIAANGHGGDVEHCRYLVLKDLARAGGRRRHAGWVGGGGELRFELADRLEMRVDLGGVSGAHAVLEAGQLTADEV